MYFYFTNEKNNKNKIEREIIHPGFEINQSTESEKIIMIHNKNLL